MKFHDINREYTNKVAEYFAQGYIINTESMEGTQGEIAKIDLIKGKELIRVWLESEHQFNLDREPNKWSGKMVILRVGKWIYEATDVTRKRTVWMKEFDVHEEKVFYTISHSYNNHEWYTDNLEEALTINAIRRARHRRVTYDQIEDITSEATIEIAKKYMKRKHGYQRVCTDKINVRKYTSLNKNDCYKIIYNGTTYRLA